MKVLIDIPKESYDFAKECKHNGTSKYNWGLTYNNTVFMIANGTPIPDNATNGDMVEKIFGKDVYCTLIRMMYSSCCEKLKNWWNAPYKRGGENEVN